MHPLAEYTRISRRAAALVAGLVLLAWSAPSWAETPLYEDDPYDLIILDAVNNHAVLKITPSAFPNRQIPNRHKPDDKLTVHLVEKPDAAYELAWRSVTEIKLFEQLVLEKANTLVAAGKFDEAYDYFHYLEQNRPNTPGLASASEDFLYEEAKQCHRDQHFDESLALLKELYRRNPKRPGLDKALGAATDKLIDRYVAAKDYAAARTLFRGLASAYPDHPVAAQWETRFKGQAEELLAKARAAVDAGRLSEAAALSREITLIWPQLSGAREFAQTIHRQYPRVVVGVFTPPTTFTPNRMDDWAARRDVRLTYRTLTEFAGSGSEGGRYDCPIGAITADNLGRRLIVQVKPGIRWAQGSETLTGLDVSGRLLAMTNPSDAAYRVDWADLLAAVSVRDLYRVEVDLRHAYVRPEAMLQTMLVPHAVSLSPDQSPPMNGPFVVAARDAGETVFVANGQYFAAEAGQPKELVQRTYPTFGKAFAALRKGEILAIDRVNPWNIATLRGEKGVVVEPYALPLVHCLIPNVTRPLMSDRTFRRAIAFGLQRQVILEQMLGETLPPGCRVTSSPFPGAVGVNDPLGYASDEKIEPRPYEPRLTIALAAVALKNYVAAQKEQGKEIKEVPHLVLAHPRDEVAQAACASIKRQLKLLGVTVDLKPFDGPPPARVPEGVDLLYAELATWEPLVDARRLLGENGPSGGCSSYMSLALRQLDEATDWGQVRERLRHVHRIAHEEAAVIPLWQLTEHFAYHENLRGTAPNPVSLYQNVEQWRPAFRYPKEK